MISALIEEANRIRAELDSQDIQSITILLVENESNDGKQSEFVREEDIAFDKWTKLVSLHHRLLPSSRNDPKKMAIEMAQLVKARNSKALARLEVNEQTSEAILDYLTWPLDIKFLEFNVFRYAKSADEQSVISLQFGYRFTDMSAQGIEQFRKTRAAWIDHALAFDMKGIHLASPRPQAALNSLGSVAR